ncbi:hypothetical protein F511_38513 [Dorcoceras hygrometricum]|uniref:Uncharacterized protein n=1 Tax=Dorcoceras hygrometricum TaxID=472368 RepID=A0A2Z7BG49_9LAMI|nr:hypothetical protein F511_38513 [Dorcoceras hygrometricum]
MPSSFITYALQVEFESVLNISDHEGMVNMFKALEASGLRGFLGCQSVFYEKELEQFFDTALVQDDDITGAVSGKYFAISESRSIFSKSGEPISTHGKKRLMKYEFRLLNDILAKSITVKAGSFDAVTNERFLMMTAIHFGIKPFPSLNILSIKTVNTYVVMNETIDARGKSDEPGMAKGAIVKRKTGSKKISKSNEEATREAPVEVISEKVVSKKRPTVVGDEATITKKKRTTKSKASSSKASMDMVSVAQDAVPLQIIKPSPVATAEQPPVLKRKSKKRKLRLPKGSDDENVEDRVAGENVENVEKPITVDVTVGETVVEPTEEERHASTQLETTDDVDVIIEQVILETSRLATDEEEQLFDETVVGEIVFGDTPVNKADDLEQWFDRSYNDFVSRDAEQLIVSNIDLGTGTTETVAGEQQVPMFVEKGTVAESEGSKDVVVAKVIEKSIGRNQIDEELMTLDHILMQISDEMMLPSVTAAEITKIKSDLPVKFKEVHDQDWGKVVAAILVRLLMIKTDPVGAVVTVEVSEEVDPQRVGDRVISPIRSTTRTETPSSGCTRSTDEFWMGFGSGPTGPGPTDEHSVHLHHRDFIVTPIADQIGPIDSVSETEYYDLKNHFSEPQCKMTVLPLNSGKTRTCVTLNGSGIQLAVGPQSLWLRNHNSGFAQWIMVKRLATSPHDPLGITDSACKNQSVVVSVQYGPFNPYIPIRSTTIGKSRVAIDPITMHTSWRSNSDIASLTRTNQYNQNLGLIHSTNGNHLESPNEGSSIDHQVTIYLHAQNITMFPTNETWYFTSPDTSLELGRSYPHFDGPID